MIKKKLIDYLDLEILGVNQNGLDLGLIGPTLGQLILLLMSNSGNDLILELKSHKQVQVHWERPRMDVSGCYSKISLNSSSELQ